MVGSSREIWCSNRETGDFMKNLETPGKPGDRRVGRYKLQAVTQVEKTLGWSKKETPIMHWSVRSSQYCSFRFFFS